MYILQYPCNKTRYCAYIHRVKITGLKKRQVSTPLALPRQCHPLSIRLKTESFFSAPAPFKLKHTILICIVLVTSTPL